MTVPSPTLFPSPHLSPGSNPIAVYDGSFDNEALSWILVGDSEIDPNVFRTGLGSMKIPTGSSIHQTIYQPYAGELSLYIKCEGSPILQLLTDTITHEWHLNTCDWTHIGLALTLNTVIIFTVSGVGTVWIDSIEPTQDRELDIGSVTITEQGYGAVSMSEEAYGNVTLYDVGFGGLTITIAELEE